MQAIAKKKRNAKKAPTYVAELSNILRQANPPNREPLVVENRIAQTRSVHVVVIWDRWKGLSSKEREKVIADAYAMAKRLRGSTITMSIGLTGEEALRMGFLPFSIVTTRREGDRASLNELHKAMADAGGIVVKIGSSTQLRFATREQAEDAYRGLSQQIPGPYWAIVHEQPSPE